MLRKLCLAGVLVAGAAASQAQYLVDQGPSTGTYSGGWEDLTGAQIFATPITLTQTSVATGYNFYGVESVGPATYTLVLYADSGSNSPGTALETMGALVASSFSLWGDQGSEPLYEAQFTGLDINLTGGTKYWMSISGNASDAGVATTLPTAGGGDCAYQSNPSGAWNDYAPNNVTYQLLGSPAPEPMSMLVLGAGAAALLRKRSRR